MKKEGIIFIFVTILLLSTILVSADDDSTNSTALVEKAYSCLEDKVASNDNCGDLSVEEQALSLLALAYDETSQKNCLSALESNSQDNYCWPSTGCELKETALATISLDYIGEDTSNAEEWLLSQNTTPDDLIWYLQIEAKEKTSCTISVNGNEYEINIDEDKKINSDAGSCLDKTNDDYWFEISSSCYDKKFEISCDVDFITNLLYQKEDSSTIFVSSETSSAPADGTTEETVDVLCFEDGGECDYEGSLWAVLALSKVGKDVTPFLPYLSAAASDNEKYFPDSFLYILTAEDLYLANLLDLQTPSDYWQVLNSPYGKYYDSSLAFFALYESGADELEDAKDYFLTHQSSDYCWPSLRDTALLLASGWPRAATTVTSSSKTSCSSGGGYCILPGDCTQANGEVLSDYYCTSSSYVCCSKDEIEETCTNKAGIICSEDESCSGSEISSSDSTNCCLGTCEEIVEYTCDNCKTTCDSDETLASGTCPLNQVCCEDKEESSGSYWWIWLLVILIIIVIILILMRNKIRVWWFEFRNKSNKKSPGLPPSPGMSRMMPPRGFPQMPQGLPRGMPPSSSIKSNEFDDTLKKLRDMSK